MALDTFSFPTSSLLPNLRYYIPFCFSDMQQEFLFSFHCTCTNTAAISNVYEHDLEEMQ